MRRFEPGEPAAAAVPLGGPAADDEPAAFASVLLQAGGAVGERLRADLAAQTATDFETVDVADGPEGLNNAIDAAAGRYCSSSTRRLALARAGSRPSRFPSGLPAAC